MWTDLDTGSLDGQRCIRGRRTVESEAEFAVIVWPQIWPTRAAENTQICVINWFLEQFCDRGRILNDTAWHSIYEIGCC
jgi:hypothetical protein